MGWSIIAIDAWNRRASSSDLCDGFVVVSECWRASSAKAWICPCA